MKDRKIMKFLRCGFDTWQVGITPNLEQNVRFVTNLKQSANYRTQKCFMMPWNSWKQFTLFLLAKKNVWVCDQEKIFIISRNVPWKKNQFSCTNGKKEIKSIIADIEDDNQRRAQGCESKPTSSLILNPCKKVRRVLTTHISVIFAFKRCYFAILFKIGHP